MSAAVRFSQIARKRRLDELKAWSAILGAGCTGCLVIVVAVFIIVYVFVLSARLAGS